MVQYSAQELDDAHRLRELLGAERAGEIRDLYWNSEIPVEEIAEAYGLADADEPELVAGLTTVLVECCDCGQAWAEFVRCRVAAWWVRAQGRARRWRCLTCKGRRILRKRLSRGGRYGGYSSYREYLAGPHWQATRKDAIARAGQSCQLCCAPSKLHVHHRTYVRLGHELPSDLIVLCADCHEAFHDKRDLACNGRGDPGGAPGRRGLSDKGAGDGGQEAVNLRPKFPLDFDTPS